MVFLVVLASSKHKYLLKKAPRKLYKQSVREFNLGKSAVFVYDYKAFYKALANKNFYK